MKPDIAKNYQGERIYLDAGVTQYKQKYYKTKIKHYQGYKTKIMPIVVGKNCTLHKESHLFVKELNINMQTIYAEIGYKISRYAQMCNNSLYKKRNIEKETNFARYSGMPHDILNHIQFITHQVYPTSLLHIIITYTYSPYIYFNGVTIKLFSVFYLLQICVFINLTKVSFQNNKNVGLIDSCTSALVDEISLMMSFYQIQLCQLRQ
ncbi:Hypothetical_protein [Hexamita inflata]|nr:Hypothetical protein HINF_LOCUS1038 [Hexamita inflata]